MSSFLRRGRNLAPRGRLLKLDAVESSEGRPGDSRRNFDLDRGVRETDDQITQGGVKNDQSLKRGVILELSVTLPAGCCCGRYLTWDYSEGQQPDLGRE